ncbi:MULTISPECIES: hypothetical protein [Mycobacteriaceae]|uniref:Uncharacterized protein n=2 Tax=Mycolicibacterium neoaurum TaxID=1795 RepID=V5XJE7_MYCNE|nr:MULTISPECIES: hypothetical protein [Mycobacteriaceae]AHC27961.1 hypothetical protein D174_15585 [Mycolicibacterium neoaurum VKM Ac-1815D]AMO06325.1 hypothetical protein MyAD_15310 [Mycolicibacterium neoaurum]AXK75328.1 hypothetical protein DXK33_09655 [Mycolicibacterium neoaurum]KJQ50999.1 hypothetical protein TS71_06740 [Mycolicibacterium neoaurum]KUM08305.1 hypothetical protein AVZ31_11855 [Mycolicibacterium neoaurum]
MSNERHLAHLRSKDEPLVALVGMIRHAVSDPVRSAGGSKADVEAIAVAAAYAAWCWGAATDESAPQPLRCG